MRAAAAVVLLKGEVLNNVLHGAATVFPRAFTATTSNPGVLSFEVPGKVIVPQLRLGVGANHLPSTSDLVPH